VKKLLATASHRRNVVSLVHWPTWKIREKGLVSTIHTCTLLVSTLTWKYAWVCHMVMK